MTITTDADRVLHTANGVTTVFSTAPIEKIDEENVEVSLIDPAGTEDPQAIGTDYALTPAGVEFNVAPADGDTVLIQRVVDLLQPDQYQTNAPFPAAVTENRFDQIVMGLQQVRGAVERAVQLHPTDAAGAAKLPPRAARAGSAMGFDGNGDFALLQSALGETPASAFGASLVAALDAAAARSLLGTPETGTVVLKNSTLSSSGITFDLGVTGSTSRALDTDLRDRAVSVKQFGAVGNGVADDTAAVQAAVDYVISINGGAIYFPRGSYLVTSTIVVDPSLAPQGSASVMWFGDGRLRSSVFANTPGLRVAEFRGARGTVFNMSFFNNNFTTSGTGSLFRLNNTTQFFMMNCWLQGGFNTLLVEGSGCTDSIFIGCSFTFATGTSNVRVNRPSGQNGAHRFLFCIFNQNNAPVQAPTAAGMKGTRTNSTAYSVGDIAEVTFGGIIYRLQCRVAGTSGGSAPSAPTFYNVDIPDGTVRWRLYGAQAYRGILFDGGTFYNWMYGCDITGPYNVGISFEDTVSTGSWPHTCWVDHCTIHGAFAAAVSAGAGARDIQVDACNIIPLNNVSAVSATGILFSTGQGNQADRCDIYGYATGINQSGSRGAITHNKVTGCTVGINLAGVSATTRVIGNEAGTRNVGGPNGTGIRLQPGATRHIVRLNMLFGATTPLTDSSGSGTNSIGDNITA